MEKEKQSEKDYAELIKVLNKHKVEYLIVGAYAVMYHTNIPRFTQDIDLWINETKDNAKRCSEAIKEFSGLNISPESLLKKGEINYLGVEPNRIDFFNAQGELSFDNSFQNKTIGKFRDTNTFYVKIEDLIAAKKYHLSMGDRNLLKSEKDLKDIKRLEAVKKKA
ncbi:MAG: nucleotidyltransferase [Endomicrobiales bacterium]|jgi:hypothetical protein